MLTFRIIPKRYNIQVWGIYAMHGVALVNQKKCILRMKIVRSAPLNSKSLENTADKYCRRHYIQGPEIPPNCIS
jgi:hypothetical protein